ncbi:MAG: hypothetical protein AAF439_09615 [Pseudomonadota bacterium]
MLGWIFFGVSLAGLIVTSLFLTSATSEVSDSRKVNKHLAATADFHFALAEEACLKKAQMVGLAKRNGWRVEDPDPSPYLPATRTEPAGGAVRVHVEPALELAKESGRTYWFDKDGCLKDVR